MLADQGRGGPVGRRFGRGETTIRRALGCRSVRAGKRSAPPKITGAFFGRCTDLYGKRKARTIRGGAAGMGRSGRDREHPGVFEHALLGEQAFMSEHGDELHRPAATSILMSDRKPEWLGCIVRVVYGVARAVPILHQIEDTMLLRGHKIGRGELSFLLHRITSPDTPKRSALVCRQ